MPETPSIEIQEDQEKPTSEQPAVHLFSKSKKAALFYANMRKKIESAQNMSIDQTLPSSGTNRVAPKAQYDLKPLEPRLSYSYSEQNLSNNVNPNGDGFLKPQQTLSNGHSRHASAFSLANSVYLSANGTPRAAPYGSHLDLASAGRIDGSSTKKHRGELTGPEKYEYDLRRAQLKASSRTSALLAGFAMVALVELQYDESTPAALLVILGFVTTILVSVHLIALMTSTCILPHIEASGCTEDSPHKQLEFFITMSWTFSTCIGLLLFLVEIVLIFFVKFSGVKYMQGAWIMLVLLVPVFIAFGVISYKIHHLQQQHSVNRVNTKLDNMQDMINSHDHNHDRPKIDRVSPIQVV